MVPLRFHHALPSFPLPTPAFEPSLSDAMLALPDALELKDLCLEVLRRPKKMEWFSIMESLTHTGSYIDTYIDIYIYVYIIILYINTYIYILMHIRVTVFKRQRVGSSSMMRGLVMW